jgi:WD40 repeat protein
MMHDELIRRSHAVLREAAALTGPEREAYIETACAGNTRLLAQVSRLVRALDDSQGFLDAPVLGTRHGRAASPDVSRAIAERIGGYRVLDVIGAGGMATVYEAMQETPHRKVALKVLRHGLVNTSAVQRFQFETEVLARLRHPGIAQIFDAGAHDDGAGSPVPYFALEFVENARQITTFAREARLSLRERLALFAEVCDAVQHGHQNGVIHRDLKPSNVLVDTAGRPKVIDFGIARSTDPEQASITHHADTGNLLGTLNYMSPEQCGGEKSLDVRTDVYSLGVILYELVTGRLPHKLSGVPLPEALRIVCEETPTRPSAIDPQLRGDVEAIVLKAIDRNPDHRYRTVAALASDIRRHLRFETIEARPLTLMYQCRLFARRNRALVNAAAVVVLTVLAGLTATSVFAYRATREAERRRASERLAMSERDEALWQAYVANMAAAFSGLQSGEIERVRRSLADAPADLRGWEWRLASSIANPSLATMDAHSDMVFGFDSSADGSTLATGGRDGTVKIWDGRTMTAVSEKQLNRGPVFAVAVSPEGRHIVAGCEDGSVVLIDRSTDVVRVACTLNDAVNYVSLSGDGLVAAATGVGQGAVWKVASGELLSDLDADSEGLIGVAYARDGSYLLTWTTGGALIVRSPDGSAIQRRLHFPAEIQCAATSADGGWIAAGGFDASFAVWDARSGDLLHVTRVARADTLVRTLAFSPDGELIASGHGNRVISVWSTRTGSILTQRRGHTETVSGVRFNAEGTRMISSSWDRTLRLWAVSPVDEIDGQARLRGHTARVMATEFAPDGSLLASASGDGTIRLWEPNLLTPVGVLHGHTDAVLALAFSPDGATLASGGNDTRIRLWDMDNGRLVADLPGHDGWVWSVAFSPDGDLLASAGEDGVVRIWDVYSHQLQHECIGHEERALAIAFSPGGRTIASVSRDHTVRLWDVETGEARALLRGHTSDIFDVLYSPDGSLLYSGSRDQSVRIWDVASGECLAVLDGHGQFITGLSLSPDGTRLAGASWFGEVLLWDTQKRDIVGSFKAHESIVRSVDFSPDGRWLATGAYDSSICLFDAFPQVERTHQKEEAAALQSVAGALARTLIMQHGSVDAAIASLESDDREPEELLPWLRKSLLREAIADSRQ